MSLSNEVTIYTAKDLVENKSNGNSSLFLKIALNAHEFLLPVINVGGEETPEYIAILDPKDPEIQEAGAEIIAQFLKKLDIDLVITAPSLKSEKMITEATENAEMEKEPLFILGGSETKNGKSNIFTKEEVQAIAQENDEEFWIEECRPITLTPDQPSKFFALTKGMMEVVLKTITEGGNIAITDDVSSSGATIESLRKLLASAAKDMDVELPIIPIIVLAREALETDEILDSEVLKESNKALNLYCSILIPVLLKIPKTD